MNYDKWIGPVENLEAFFLLNLELLIYHSVKELLLVVGAGCQTLSSDPDVFFVPVPQHLVLPDTGKCTSQSHMFLLQSDKSIVGL